MTTKEQHSMTTMILLDLIDEPAFNSRLPKKGKALKAEGAKLDALRLSLITDGQRTPIEVFKKPDGRFERISGGRRCAAMKATGAEKIMAIVLDAQDPKIAARLNIVENTVREDLTTYEKARAAAYLRDIGYSVEDGSNLMPGTSKTYFANLSTSYVNLPTPILADWEAEHPAANVDKLREIANRKKFPTVEEQTEAWDQHCRDYAKKEGRADKGKKRGAETDDGGDDGGDTGGGGFTIVQRNMRALVYSLKGAGKSAVGNFANPKEAQVWGAALIDFAMGQTETMPAGIQLDPEDAKKEAEKVAAKAAKAAEKEKAAQAKAADAIAAAEKKAAEILAAARAKANGETAKA